MNFKQFLEMGEKLTAPIDDVQLHQTPSGVGFYSTFVINGDEYKVKFVPMSMTAYFSSSTPLVFYGISFTGPKAYELTGYNLGTRVYGELIRIVRKFIQEQNPAGFSFSGWSDKQSIMYDYLFKKYMSKDFVQVDSSAYMSKDYLNKLATLAPKIYEKITKWANSNSGIWQQTSDNMRRQKRSPEVPDTTSPVGWSHT